MGDTRDDAHVAGVRPARGRRDRLIAAGAVTAVAAGLWAVIAQPWDRADGWPDTENWAPVGVWLTDPPADPLEADGIEILTSEQWEAAIADVRAVDPEAVVMLTAPVVFADREGSITPLQAVDGPLPAGALVEGTAPGPGQVVVSSRYRDEHGWEIGDRLALAVPEGGAAPFDSLELVGFSNDEAFGFASWGDAPALAEAYAVGNYGAVGDRGDAVLTDGALFWDGDVPAGLEAARRDNP
ncbi:hypothetical protein [Demequina silvatica]|uniref:hypothetical protein n=1 Tax=Demequina silvatica TaxID=1638988 RepID=UPI0007833428|nr:hypothetical protein [Demequina silvatica]